MDVPAHLEGLRADGARLADAASEAGPGAPVPTCPEWAVRDLVRHQGGVHRWATGIVAGPRTEPWNADLEEVAGGWPADGDLLAWFREGHAALVAALEAAPDDLDCWTFLPAPSPRAMWARRQAHETAVHRVDAELAAGRPPHPFAPPFAADGVDELLTCFVPRRRTNLRADAATSLAVRCTDDEASWTVHVDEDGTRTEPGAAADAACTLRGRATDLYATLWNRAGPGRLAVEGDPAVLDLFLDHVHVRWA